MGKKVTKSTDLEMDLSDVYIDKVGEQIILLNADLLSDIYREPNISWEEIVDHFFNDTDEGKIDAWELFKEEFFEAGGTKEMLKNMIDASRETMAEEFPEW